MTRKVFCIVLAVVMCLGFMACAGIQTAGQSAEDFICNPPANVVALAQAADPFISIAAAAGGSVALMAYQGIRAILSGGVACATVTQVNAIISLLQGQQTKAMKMGKAASFTLDPQPMIDWLAKAAPGK